MTKTATSRSWKAKGALCMLLLNPDTFNNWNTIVLNSVAYLGLVIS